MHMLKLCKRLRNKQEALSILSALGFGIDDYPTLEKLGGYKEILTSDLIERIIKENKNFSHLEKISQKFYSLLDLFYEEDGSLISPIEEPRCRLLKINKAPLVFFVRFNSSLINWAPSVAIIGSRRASKEGQRLSHDLAYSLAEKNMVIISGGAVGIDSSAHQGSLSAGGCTVVVSGLYCTLRKDSLYEKFKDHKNRCAIVYPYGPFAPQGKYMFVGRNSFVAALADILVVVQGQEGSGTLHTVKQAKKLGIPIFAIPGALNDPLARVPNQLIAKKEAQALTDISMDFSSFIDKKVSVAKKIKKTTVNEKDNQLLPELIKVFKIHGPRLSMQDLIDKTNRPFLDLQRELLVYELQGKIVKSGPQFVLTDN